jgi:MarR family transcriptional regulator, organic hydroperoxide resistance regulator
MAASTARTARRRNPTSGVVEIDAETSVELDEVLQFMRTLWVTVHSLQKASKRMNRVLGVTGPQRLVVRVIGLSPGISAGGLATVLHLHPSTLTGVIKRLEGQRLITRARDAGDARRAVLRLTAAGRRLNVPTSGTVEALLRKTLAAVPRDEQRAARAVLERLAQGLAPRQPARRTGAARRV